VTGDYTLVAEIGTPTSWRWRLEQNGMSALLFDVDLDGCAELDALTDLPGYLRRRQDEDGQAADAVVAELGGWLRERVLGPQIADRLGGRIVDVRLNAAGAFLVGAPLELTLVDGKALARSMTTFVYRVNAAPSGDKKPVAERLRILALLAAPSPGSLLQLRRERFELVRSIRAAAGGRPVDLRVLQYGVTDGILRDALETDPGWDVLHLCFGGGTSGICLQGDDGTLAELPADDLIDMLAPTVPRLKLVVLSANRSGAGSVTALRALGLPDEADQLERDLLTPAATPPGPGAIGALAQRLADELDVAVVAMRYPVADQFAIDFARELYGLLLKNRQPVDRALAMSRRRMLTAPDAPLLPMQSLAAPVLYGGQAVGLRIVPPDVTGAGPYDQRTLPALDAPEPARLIGHVSTLGKASGALAVQSGYRGVLFVGDAGVGKTTCALELTYQHWDDFVGRAWWRLPIGTTDFARVRHSLFEAWQSQLGFQIREDVGTADGLAQFATRLRAWLAEVRILLALDGIEALLTPQGGWRDPAWEVLMAAMTGHGGESRTLLTSRVAPAPGLTQVLVGKVETLSVPESVLLTCELPSLGRLLHHAPAPGDDPARGVADRAVIHGVLKAANGSPYLLEQADGIIGFARPHDCVAGDPRRTLVDTAARCAANPGDPAAGVLHVLLTGLAGGPLWTEAAPVLERLVGGEPGDPLARLGEEAATLVTEVLAQLPGFSFQ
jgi:hypothetical protein